jgi:hypothetical protein
MDMIVLLVLIDVGFKLVVGKMQTKIHTIIYCRFRYNDKP